MRTDTSLSVREWAAYVTETERVVRHLTTRIDALEQRVRELEAAAEREADYRREQRER